MEYDYYYEPKIKTARNDDVQILNRCTFGNENEFKEELISFIRDKIQENIDKNKRTNFDLDVVYTGKISSLQEVLDFVNKGGKDE